MNQRGIYRENFSIDPFYLFFLVNTIQVGIGILRAPRVMAESVKNETWIPVLLGALLVQLLLWIMFYLLKKYENLSVLEIGNLLFGKPLNYFFSIMIAGYYFLLSIFVLWDFIGIMQDFIFPTTSPVLLSILFLYPIFLILRGGISLLTRFSVIVLFSTIWLFFFLYYVYVNAQWEFLFPLFQQNVVNYAKGARDITLDYFGFEIVFFMYPLFSCKEKVFLYTSLSHWFTTIIYLSIIIGATGLYGSEMLKHQVYPTMDMFRLVELPFIERIEIIGVSVWSMLIVMSIAGFLWISDASLTYISPRLFIHHPFVLILLVFVSLFFLPQRFVDIDRFVSYLGTYWLYAMMGGSVVMLLISSVRHGRKEKKG